MLDRTSFGAIVRDQLRGLNGGTAVELHLHGGESFFLCCIKQVRDTYALCDIVPMHEWNPNGSSRFLRPQEAAVPYATIARMAVSTRRVGPDQPVGFRGVNGAGS